jgi:hypothetical protein
MDSAASELSFTRTVGGNAIVFHASISP